MPPHRAKRRRGEILKGGMPTRREMLKIFKDASVEPEAPDHPGGTPIQPVTRHCNGRRPGIGRKMLKRTRKPRSHDVLRRQQRENGENHDAKPCQNAKQYDHRGPHRLRLVAGGAVRFRKLVSALEE